MSEESNTASRSTKEFGGNLNHELLRTVMEVVFQVKKDISHLIIRGVGG